MKRKFKPTDQAANIQVDFDALLDWITANVYDATHMGNLTGNPQWVVDVYSEPSGGLLDWLREKSGLTNNQMKARFDAARIRVHGPNVKGGR